MKNFAANCNRLPLSALMGAFLVIAATSTAFTQSAPAHPLVVEIVATPGATLLDFAGPSEVFGVIPGHAVEYVVSEGMGPFKLENGVKIAPDYTFDDAPKPDIVVIGSQAVKGSDTAMAWLRGVHARGGLVMSVCTGADWLGQSGLLAGLEATTHHHAYSSFQRNFSDVKVVRGRRYVESEANLFTAGGYTAGLDLALHLVDERYGRKAAQDVARRLEYKGDGWITNEW
ncbi:MAG: DJ-1/PfpI family protein [Rhizomicrobium sp.]|jgi:transcriptional regulator GlxA family with amidase domain